MPGGSVKRFFKIFHFFRNGLYISENDVRTRYHFEMLSSVFRNVFCFVGFSSSLDE
jgi:hypothetical protein